jgi:hypothetical protein
MRLISFFVAACLALGASVGLRAAGPPSPAESILIIYTDADPTAYSVTLKNAFVTALSAVVPAPTITQVNVAAGQVGIYNSLVAQTGQTSLSNWCQVWDLRFISSHNSASYSGTIQGDSITSGCPTCDQELFLEFLRRGGHLFMQGDHAEYFARNESLVSFIQTATGSTLSYPSITVSPVYWTTHDNTAPDLFSTNYDGVAIGQIGSWLSLSHIQERCHNSNGFLRFKRAESRQ